MTGEFQGCAHGPGADATQLYLLGREAMGRGRVEEAIQLLNRATKVDPLDPLAWFYLGSALQQSNRSAATDAYRQAATLDPHHLESVFNLGNLLAEDDRFEDAIAAYEKALVLHPELPQIHNNLGNALASAGRLDEAESALRMSLSLAPDNPDTWVNLANVLLVGGSQQAAIEATDRALALQPGHAAAWFARSEMKTYEAGDVEIDQLRAAAYLTPNRPVAEHINLQFALGKALMDAGDVDEAFIHVAGANRLKRAGLTYDVQEDVKAFKTMAQVFDRAFLDRFAGVGEPTDAPIFILGMPRSGTTLVEQILASHPAVFGAGELDALMNIVSAVVGSDLNLETVARRLARLTGTDFKALGKRYLSAVSSDGARFTDKMPANFRLVGLINIILPGARIIHCVRDPIDTCWSCYTKHFSSEPPFTYDLRELGTYYRAYERLMTHWREVIPPDRFVQTRYETLVETLEPEARRLAAFCELPWDDAMLDFHRHSRPVRTASASQVRRPIYRSSLERWRPYERHLRPLIDALREP